MISESSKCSRRGSKNNETAINERHNQSVAFPASKIDLFLTLLHLEAFIPEVKLQLGLKIGNFGKHWRRF